jgi:hypothetical protein
MMNESSKTYIDALVSLCGGPDAVDHLWYVDEHEDGSVLTPVPTVADEDNRIYYVDVYSAGRLMLYIPETGSYTVANPHRSLALDSNMFEGFKRYVVDGERGTKSVVGMEQLIDYAIVQKYSTLPTPYLLEVIADRGLEAARPYCEKIIEAVLRLIHMDGSVFMSCREFVFSESALDNLERKYGARSFEEAAKGRTAAFIEEGVMFRSHYFTSYLAVLALVAIGSQHEDRDARIAAFDDLFLKRTGGPYPRYLLLSRLYYYDKISDWIGCPPGSDKFTAQLIRSSAYDVSLTMLNEEIMHVSKPYDPDAVMLITRDRKLALNAPMVKLKAMSLMKNGRLQVLNPWDEARVADVFGRHAGGIIADIDAKLNGAKRFQLSPDELLAIIKEYEIILNVAPSALSSLKF